MLLLTFWESTFSVSSLPVMHSWRRLLKLLITQYVALTGVRPTESPIDDIYRLVSVYLNFKAVKDAPFSPPTKPRMAFPRCCGTGQNCGGFLAQNWDPRISAMPGSRCKGSLWLTSKIGFWVRNRNNFTKGYSVFNWKWLSDTTFISFHVNLDPIVTEKKRAAF